jgi:hypothetical protein
MQDHEDREFTEHTLSLEQVRKLLSGVPSTPMEDASWTWSRPEDEFPARRVRVAAPACSIEAAQRDEEYEACQSARR